MEYKQRKQMEQFLAMANKSDYFLLLDDKSKQIYKVKINNRQRYDPYQIKKEELSGEISTSDIGYLNYVFIFIESTD